MRSGKGKRRQTSTNQKNADHVDAFTQIKQEHDIPNSQQLEENKHQQHPMENNGEDIENHSDDTGSQRSWSPVIKPRRRFSAHEIEFLEAEYAQDINPSSEQLEIMAQTIGTTRRVITTWFQNHRAKGKRNNKTSITTKKIKKCKRSHVIAPKSKAGKNNLTQPKMIGSVPGSSYRCINQTTIDEDYRSIFSATPPDAASTISLLDINHPPVPVLNSYFVPDSVPPIATDTTPWNHGVYPTFSSTTPLNTWPTSLTTLHHHPAPPPPPTNLSNSSVTSNSALPQCCIDEIYTGYPCPFHTSLYI